MRRVQSFTGPNIYSHQPAVVLRLGFEAADAEKSSEIPGFAARLLDLLPGLGEHSCGAGGSHTFTGSLERGTNFNHIAEHVALELLARAGGELPRGKACRGDGSSKIIIETRSQTAARILLPFAADLVEALIEGKTLNVEDEIADAKRVSEREEPGADASMIIKAAAERGIPWTLVDEPDLVQLGYGVNLRLIRGALTDAASLIAAEAARDAYSVRRRLGKFSIPVPDTEIVRDERGAVRAFESIGAPVVVRPESGSRENGVSLDLSDPDAVAEAFRAASEQSSRVLVEEQFKGKSYRLLIIGGRMIAARENAAGGAAGDVTSRVHGSIRNLCERAARAIGLDVCVVHFVAEDVSVPYLQQEKSGIVDVDAATNLQLHAFSDETRVPDIGRAIVEMLYPEGKPARIPIVSITGTNGKTSVTRMAAHILSTADRYVGMTTSTGIYLNGERVVKGDTTGPISARTILGDKAVDVAVLETARGGIVRRGLGYDWSDVAVLTNIGEDHIGQDGIESIKDLIDIKALVVERVRPGGTLVVNADDPDSLGVLERERVKSPPRKIVYFSMSEDNPRVREHLCGGGTAYFPANDFIVEAAGEERSKIVKIGEIPVTLGGTADFQIANSMAAIAACRAVGVSREQCAAQLGTFRNDADNPGRNNLYKVGAGYVLVDYGHNTDGFAAVARMARRWVGKTVTGIIGLPGDRDNRIIEEAAAVAARGFDRVIVTEEVNRRGRAVGEMADLLCGAISRVDPDRECEIVLDELEAFSKALAEMRKNEVVVIFYRQLDLILEILARHNAVPVSSFEETSGAADKRGN